MLFPFMVVAVLVLAIALSLTGSEEIDDVAAVPTFGSHTPYDLTGEGPDVGKLTDDLQKLNELLRALRDQQPRKRSTPALLGAPST